MILLVWHKWEELNERIAEEEEGKSSSARATRAGFFSGTSGLARQGLKDAHCLAITTFDRHHDQYH